MHAFKQGFSVREPMWHGLGEVLADYPGREEAMRIAGHDFEILEQPVDVGGKPVEGWKGLVRSDTEQVLHLVKDTYVVLQPEVIWDIADAMAQEPNVRYETAGVLKDGAIMWVLAWLDEPVVIKGDISPTLPFVLVSTSHDATASAKAAATSVRVVCWNTFSQSSWESQKLGSEFTFRHTKRVMERIDEARQAIRGARAAHAHYIEEMNELAGLDVTQEKIERFVVEFIPAPPETLISDRVRGNVEDARAMVRNLIHSESLAETPRTAYTLVQAATEYLDHLRTARSDETRFRRTLLRPEPLKARAVALARRVASN